MCAMYSGTEASYYGQERGRGQRRGQGPSLDGELVSNPTSFYGVADEEARVRCTRSEGTEEGKSRGQARRLDAPSPPRSSSI